MNEFPPGDPTFDPGPAYGSYNGIIATIQQALWIAAEPVDCAQVHRLRQSGDITEKVWKDFSHPIKLIKIVFTPRQSRRSAMGGDDCDTTFEGEPESFDASQIVSMGRERKLASSVCQLRKLKSGKT